MDNDNTPPHPCIFCNHLAKLNWPKWYPFLWIVRCSLNWQCKAGDRWQMTGNIWQVTGDTGCVTHDMWQVKFVLYFFWEFGLISAHIKRLSVTHMQNFSHMCSLSLLLLPDKPIYFNFFIHFSCLPKLVLLYVVSYATLRVIRIFR